MDEIRPWLYIGKYRDTLDKDLLDFNSIRAMLQFAEPIEQEGSTRYSFPWTTWRRLPII
jgi:hypothetical protein